MKKYVLGIDLGTYNSTAAVVVVDPSRNVSEPRIIYSSQTAKDDFESESGFEKLKSFPSFVSYHSDGSVDTIGLVAKKRLINNPKYVVWGVKRLLGKTYSEARDQGELERFLYTIEPDPETGKCLIVVGERKYRPEDICGEIIKEIKKEAEKEIGVLFSDVIISKPAYFDAIHATPIVQVAKIAGFRSVKTIPEPVAASIAYKILVTAKPVHVLVFDLGAGTLDVTVGNLIRKGPNPFDLIFQSKITTGNTHLGGVDMDDRISRLLMEKSDLSDTVLSSVDKIKIRRKAEETKIRLSQELEVSVGFEVNSRKYSVSINRLELEMSLRGHKGEVDIIEECRKQVIAAIKGAFWTPEEVDQILPIGGPSCMPSILQMLKEVFHRNPKVLMQLEEITIGKLPVDPMNAVAKGAALSSETRKSIPHPYGYGFVDVTIQPNQIIEKPNILIPRGSTYPCMSQEPYVISWFRQAATTEIEVIQHVPETEPIPEYRQLGSVDIAIKEPGKSQIELTMGLNDNEELIVKLRDTYSGKEVQYIGIGHFRRIPIQLPRVRETTARSQLQRFEVDEAALKDLVSWAQMVYRLCRNKMEDADFTIVNNIRPFINKLNDTFIFYVWDDKGNLDLKKANEHWNDILNSVNPLLHRAIELGLIEVNQATNLERHGADIENRLLKPVS